MIGYISSTKQTKGLVRGCPYTSTASNFYTYHYVEFQRIPLFYTPWTRCFKSSLVTFGFVEAQRELKAYSWLQIMHPPLYPLLGHLWWPMVTHYRVRDTYCSWGAYVSSGNILASNIPNPNPNQILRVRGRGLVVYCRGNDHGGRLLSVNFTVCTYYQPFYDWR